MERTLYVRSALLLSFPLQKVWSFLQDIQRCTKFLSYFELWEIPEPSPQNNGPTSHQTKQRTSRTSPPKEDNSPSQPLFLSPAETGAWSLSSSTAATRCSGVRTGARIRARWLRGCFGPHGVRRGRLAPAKMACRWFGRS